MPKNVAMEKRHSAHATGGARVSRTEGAATRARSSRPPFEQLARESGCPLDLVLDLYERELVRLEHDARIRSYIPVLAMKRVRDALKGIER